MADEKDGKNKDQNKDLTGLIEFSKSLADSGNAPPVPEGSVMEEAPLEKIDEFESLEQYAKSEEASQPSTPSPQEPPPEAASPAPPEPNNDLPISEALEAAPDLAPPPTQESGSGTKDFVTSEFPATPDFSLGSGLDSQPSSESTPETSDPLAAPMDFGSPDPQNPDFASPQSPAETPDFLSAGNAGSDGGNDPGFLGSQGEFQETPPSSPPIPETPEAPPSNAAPPSPPPPKPQQPPAPKAGISVSAKTPVNAAIPFSVLISGKLTPEEKEKLLDVISREKMGIRELDLEPQLESGRVLIPRISEYAAVLIVQTMRATHAQIKIGPSDLIFATQETREEADTTALSAQKSVAYSRSENANPGDLVPITTLGKMDGVLEFSSIEAISASAVLSSKSVEIENSSEYLEMLEALKLELKYKAYHKGADAILDLRIQLTSLNSPSLYRLTVTGSAARVLKEEIPPPETEPEFPFHSPSV